MANYYRETIAKGLRYFDNEGHADDYYMDLAWKGLQETTAYENLSWQEKEMIKDTSREEKEYGTKNCYK